NIIPTFGRLKLSEITEDQINTWLLNLKHPRMIGDKEEKGLANSTANKMLKILSGVLDIAVKRKLIQDNPAKLVHKLCDQPKKRGIFSVDEAKKILGHKEYWSSHLAYLASYLSAVTGMRQGEIRALTASDIKESYLEVGHSFDRTVGVKGTKADKVRHVPVPGEIRKELLHWAPDNGFIFSLTNGSTPVSPDHLLDGLKDAAVKAGISKAEIERRNLCFHSWRHFFNTRLIASGVQGEITRAVVGHESEEMTERYLHLSVGDMEAVAKVQRSLIKIVG
ncbi:MAG: tyrosine-type recombinase/integrase, partial [Sphaerochaetaceae bacterium]